MKAALIRDYGAAIEIADIDQPALPADSVRIKVHAAGLNPIDNILRSGIARDAMPIPFPFVLGFDLSGEIVELGADVQGWAVGDEVFARPASSQAGTIAEYTVTRAAELAKKPHSISHLEAASIPLAGLTAWQGLFTKGGLQAGQKVLIQAGSGGVGSLAIQIAKHAGAYVATTTSGGNAEMVKALGADEMIDYRTENFADRLSGYDLVFDTLGGQTLNDGFKVLKPGGVQVSVKGVDTEGLADKLGMRFEAFYMWPDGKMLSDLGDLIENGHVRPILDRVFPLGQTQDAYEYLQTGRARGKVVVEIA